jgi:chromosome segregation ATPase
MTPEGKTAAAIAAEIGVSRQAVYKRLKVDNSLSTKLTRFTFTVHNTVYYTEDGERLIKSAFSEHDVNQTVNRVNQNVNQTVNRVNQSVNQVDSGSQPEKDSTALIESLHKRLEDKDGELDVLREQLKQKDAQIAELQEQNARLTRTLDNTVMALTAAQALHAADKQQQLLTDTADDRSESQGKKPFWVRWREKRAKKKEAL